ncbi:MAG: hypothetical protein ACO26G_03730 [Rickettsiales bacterium]
MANGNFSDRTYSILSVKYVVNDEVANRVDSRFKCKLSFRDDYKEKVEVIEDNESNYITLISNPGKIYLEYVNCNSHNIPLIFGKSRKKYIEDWGFVAHQDFLNYAGEITINFDASSFQILDFINYKYTEFSKHRLIKSLFTENRKLQPNDFSKDDIIQNSTQYFHQKNPNENNYNNNQTENNNVKISQKDLNPKPDNSFKNAVKKPIHPYLAPIYSDYYNPIFNPYNTVNLAPNPYLAPSSEIQDPAIDRYYFDDEIKNLDLK